MTHATRRAYGLALIILTAACFLAGCTGAIVREVAKDAVPDAVTQQIAALIKAKADSDAKAAAALKTSAEARTKVAADDAQIEATEAILAEQKKARADDQAAATQLRQEEVSHQIRVWSVVGGILSALAFGLGIYLGVAGGLVSGIWGLITGSAPGHTLRIAGLVGIGAAVVIWTIAPAWYAIYIGFLVLVGCAIVTAAVYEIERHRKVSRFVACQWKHYAQQIPADLRTELDKTSLADQGKLKPIVDQLLKP